MFEPEPEDGWTRVSYGRRKQSRQPPQRLNVSHNTGTFQTEDGWTAARYGHRGQPWKPPQPRYAGPAPYPVRDRPQQPQTRSYASVTRGRSNQRTRSQSRSRANGVFRRPQLISRERRTSPFNGDRYNRARPRENRETRAAPAAVLPRQRPPHPDDGPRRPPRMRDGGSSDYQYSRGGWNGARPWRKQQPDRHNGPVRQIPLPTNTVPQHRIESQDPDFSHKVRLIHKVIKFSHHLKNISGTDPPPNIRKTTLQITDFIKPASPNPATQTLLQGNARNWEHTTILILRQHYEDNIFRDIQELAKFTSNEWEGPFEVATLWSRRKLGRRLKQETLEETEALLRAHLEQDPNPRIEKPTTPPCTDIPHAALSLPSGDLIPAAAATPTPPAVSAASATLDVAPPAPTTTTIIIPAQVHAEANTPTPPPPRSPAASQEAPKVSVSTMTDRQGGDWSPYNTSDPEKTSPSSSSPSPPPPPPPPPPSHSAPQLPPPRKPFW